MNGECFFLNSAGALVTTWTWQNKRKIKCKNAKHFHTTEASISTSKSILHEVISTGYERLGVINLPWPLWPCLDYLYSPQWLHPIYNSGSRHGKEAWQFCADSDGCIKVVLCSWMSDSCRKISLRSDRPLVACLGELETERPELKIGLCSNARKVSWSWVVQVFFLDWQSECLPERLLWFSYTWFSPWHQEGHWHLWKRMQQHRCRASCMKFGQKGSRICPSTL